MHGVDGDKVYGTLYIEVGKGSGTSSKGDLTYQVDPDDDVTLDAADLRRVGLRRTGIRGVHRL